MFRVPAVPIIRSTILQLAVISTTYITLDDEMYGNVHFKGCPESGGWSHRSAVWTTACIWFGSSPEIVCMYGYRLSSMKYVSEYL
jgi:hypothetical protein